MTMVLVGDPAIGPWSLELTDAEMVHLGVSPFQFVIELRDHEHDDDLSITVAGRFRAGVDSEAPMLELDAGSRDPQLGALIVALKQTRLVECRGDAQGTLWLRFDTGAEIEVPADPDYESWEIGHGASENSPHEFQLICMPGGEIALFFDPVAITVVVPPRDAPQDDA